MLGPLRALGDKWPVAVDAVFGCHLWTGARSSNGYPLVDGRQSAHRVAYEHKHGAIPTERVLDHLCRRPRCVNDEHLEAVTKSENERRKSLRYRLQRRTCRRGHVLDEASRLMTPEMGVLCRACAKETR